MIEPSDLITLAETEFGDAIGRGDQGLKKREKQTGFNAALIVPK